MAKLVIEDRAEIEAVLRQAEVGSLGLVCPDGAPYVVPVNFIYIPEDEYRERFSFADDVPGAIGRVILHCAPAGRKLDCIAREPRACLTAYTEVRMVYTSERACDCSCRYECAMCHGTARVVTNHEQKRALLTALSAHYMQREIEPPGEERTRKTGVVEIVVTELTGKRNVDPEG